MSRHPRSGIRISNDALAIVQNISDALDVNMVVVASALIEGAYRSGRYHVYVEEFLARGGVLRTTRFRPQLPWEQVNDEARNVQEAKGPSRAGRYRYKEWELYRIGVGARNPKPGTGWFLSHPSWPEPKFLGNRRPDAMREATEFVIATEAAHATE